MRTELQKKGRINEDTRIYDYIDVNSGKILNKGKIENMFNSGDWDASDIKELFSRSPIHARRLIRDILEKKYRKLMREKPDVWYAKMQKKDIEDAIKKGEDPFDRFYLQSIGKEGDSLVKKEKFMEFLTLLFRAISGVSF